MFCQELEDQSIILVEGPLGAEAPFGTTGWSQPRDQLGECKRYSEDVYRKSLEASGGGTQYSLQGRNITISLAWDNDGCQVALEPTPYRAVNFGTYGVQNCQSMFVNNTINACKLSNQYLHDTNLGKFTSVGGIYWENCLRWTIVAIEDSLAPPDTLFGYSWG